MKILNRVWKDISQGENIDLYVTVVIASAFTVLDIFGVASQSLTVPLTLGLMALISVSIRYYSGHPSSGARDEGGACQSIMNGINHVQPVFAGRRDVAANRTEGLGTSACTEST